MSDRSEYWRNAYETLVDQTGRDLNDGLGLDPRKTVPSKSARTRAAIPTSGGVEEALQKARRPTSYPDFLDDRDGLERWRDISSQGDGHDMCNANKNTVLRFVQTIDRLERALSALSAVPGRIDLEAFSSVAGLADANSALPVCLDGAATPSGMIRDALGRLRKVAEERRAMIPDDWRPYAEAEQDAKALPLLIDLETIIAAVSVPADEGDIHYISAALSWYDGGPAGPDVHAAWRRIKDACGYTGSGSHEGIASKPDDTREASKPKARATKPKTSEPRIDLEEAAADTSAVSVSPAADGALPSWFLSLAERLAARRDAGENLHIVQHFRGEIEHALRLAAAFLVRRAETEAQALSRAGYPGKVDITQALMGPHEWGYRCVTEGTFIADDAPFAAAELISHFRAADPHADRGVEEPGLGWKLSDKAKAEIDAIEEAQRQGARNAHNIIVGAARTLPSKASAAANQNPSDVKPPVVPRDLTKAKACDLTTSELIAEQTRVEKLWDAMWEPDEDGNVFEGHGGSPGEWMVERMDEIATEQARRQALSVQRESGEL